MITNKTIYTCDKCHKEFENKNSIKKIKLPCKISDCEGRGTYPGYEDIDLCEDCVEEYETLIRTQFADFRIYFEQVSSNEPKYELSKILKEFVEFVDNNYNKYRDLSFKNFAPGYEDIKDDIDIITEITKSQDNMKVLITKLLVAFSLNNDKITDEEILKILASGYSLPVISPDESEDKKGDNSDEE